MDTPRILYSVNTRLAFTIAERYYGNIHFVWCAPRFDASGTNPPSSNPREIMRALGEDVRRGDRHSERFKENISGIRRGARAKAEAGIISSAQKAEIGQIVRLAQYQDFQPLLFIIPFADIDGMIEDVPIKDRAHPLSLEYLIRSLPRRSFDIIDDYRG